MSIFNSRFGFNSNVIFKIPIENQKLTIFDEIEEAITTDYRKI